MRLFHGTTTTRLNSIILTGIVPKREKGSSMIKEGKQIKAVCLTKSKRIAIAWANRKTRTDQSKPIVIEITNQNLVLEDGFEERFNLNQSLSLKVIPPRNIKSIHFVKTMKYEKIISTLKRPL